MSRHATIAAAAAAFLLPLTARAAGSGRLAVGATVVASATVSAVLQSDARTGRIQVHASAGRTSPPMLLVGRDVVAMSDSIAPRVGSGEASVVTVLY